jgi:spermidine synthase
MSILWYKNTKHGRYEVRSAGNSVRLYTNGVFHSQYNAKNPISGNLWDLLMLPGFFYKPGHIQRVLVLGVGGGTVIRLLNHYLEPQEIVGVELNPVHLQVARDYFGVTSKQAKLIQADAITWIKNYQGPAFDMIIDDLFGEADGEPTRAAKANASWFDQLLSHLTPNGLVVMNFISQDELKACAYFSNQRIRHRFKSAFRFTIPRYENVVAAFTRPVTTSQKLRNNLIKTTDLDPKAGTSGLEYQIRRL